MMVRNADDAARLITARLLDLLLVLALVAGVAVAALPVLTDLGSSMTAARVISSMTASVDRTEDPNRLQSLAQAQAYNLELGGKSSKSNNAGMGGSNETEDDIRTPKLDKASEIKPYVQQLSIETDGALCWLEIPCLSLRLPVYHGTGDETLAAGVGHLATSSLPVGGTSSHCVLAAHSGMQDTSMFDGIEKLAKGDVFVLHTLGDAYCYEVTEVRTVLPRDAETLCGIREGEDLCTLLTCTPYGINSHRLLVTGTRRTYDAQQTRQNYGMRREIVDRRSIPLLACAGGLVASAILFVTVRALSHRRDNAPVSYHRRPGRRR